MSPLTPAQKSLVDDFLEYFDTHDVIRRREMTPRQFAGFLLWAPDSNGERVKAYRMACCLHAIAPQSRHGFWAAVKEILSVTG